MVHEYVVCVKEYGECERIQSESQITDLNCLWNDDRCGIYVEIPGNVWASLVVNNDLCQTLAVQ